MDLLLMCHPITVHLEFTELLRENHSLLMLLETVCMSRCFIYTPVDMEMMGTPNSDHLDVGANNFGNIV